MKRLAVMPSDPIEEYLKGGYSEARLRDYYNPCHFFDEVCLLSPNEKDREEWLGMKVIHTPVSDLKRRIKDFSIDVVRAYGGNWACRAACENKLKGVPVVVSVHDTRMDRLYDAIRDADMVFAMSGVVKDLVLTKFKNRDRVWVLPNRVDFQVMRPMPGEDISLPFPFKYKILFVGRLDEVKNLDTLIKALNFLGPEYGLMVIGTGDVALYQDMAKNEGVGGQCLFIDRVKNENLARYYSWCDCVCAPSRHEAFPMVLIEALACGAVYVTSDIAPLREFIKDKENGLLVREYENPALLAQSIQKACEDPALRACLKAHARKSVECFETSKVDALEADYYQKILEMKKEGLFSYGF
ncbi:MAG: glycosyltransferase family 4 protein [Candidatus Omnitrophica bacterium]|nr:glycosyltransferase family 4 protein [Candidatus Omnitrophota bacterium]